MKKLILAAALFAITAIAASNNGIAAAKAPCDEPDCGGEQTVPCTTPDCTQTVPCDNPDCDGQTVPCDDPDCGNGQTVPCNNPDCD